MASGDGNGRLIVPMVSAIGGLLIGVVAIVTFLFGNFLTIRGLEEFRQTLNETQKATNEHMQRTDESVKQIASSLAKIQGFIEAHKR